MERLCLRTGVLLLVSLSAFAASEATTTRAVRIGRPGFLFTRSRGRCTPRFWSSGSEAWPRMVPQTSTVSKVFGSRASERFRSDLTLLEATRRDDSDDAFHMLLQQASAALLNSYARRGFPYLAWEVKTLVIQALVSEQAAALQAKGFAVANEVCN